jgi:iron complex outermembrane receptor protein
MKQVIVSATKTKEQRKDIANSVIYKNEGDVQESPYRTVGEFLANERGIDLRTYGNYGGAPEEIHIRGMSGTGTQIFVNGQRVGSPALGSADVGKIPLNAIERIEVVKGSGSVLYGSGAMGGTVHIYTKRPQRDKISLTAGAGYGSDDTYQISAEHGMFVWGGLGYYLTANYRSTDGFRHNSDLDHRDVSLKLVYEKDDILDVSLYGDYIDRQYGVPGVEPPKHVQFIGRRDANRLSHGTDRDAHLVLNIEVNPLNWLGVHLKGDLLRMENFYHGRWYQYPSLGVPEGLPGTDSWVTNWARGVEGNVHLKPLEGATLLLGGEYRDYDWKNESINLDLKGKPIARTRTRTHAGVHTSGAYAEAQYRPCPYFKGVAGIRYEAHSQFGDEVLPRYGIIINPFEGTAIKASHGRHFRAPTPNDLYWPFDGFTEGNPHLRPEIGWHTDVTVEQSLFNDKVFLTASYFHWDLDNRILWLPDSQGIWTPINLRQYEADGVEVGARIGPFYNFTLSLNYTYLHAKEQAKDYSVQDYGFAPWFPPNFQYEWVKRRASYTPKSLFKGSLTYWTDFGLTATAVVRYVGNRVWYRTQTNGAYPFTKTVRYTLPSYWTVDAKVEQRLFDHWILSLQANNLLNEEYDTYYGTFTDPSSHPAYFFGRTTVEGFPGAGRSVFFMVTYEH